MEFIDVLPSSEGKDKILVVVNQLTKFAHFMAIKKTDTAKQIADVFCKNIYKLHGFPKVIISDRDAKFNGKFWRYFFKQVGTSLNIISSYHPQRDGLTKFVNKCLEAYICCFVIDKKNHWSQWLDLEEWWYNSTYHTSVKMTPFKALYGYEPPNWKELVLNDTNVPKLRNQLEKTKK